MPPACTGIVVVSGLRGASMKEFVMPGSKYGPTSTAAEIVADVDLHGRRAVVTGASSGIGVETARALASTGADVTLAVRIVEAGHPVPTRQPQNSAPRAPHTRAPPPHPAP